MKRYLLMLKSLALCTLFVFSCGKPKNLDSSKLDSYVLRHTGNNIVEVLYLENKTVYLRKCRPPVVNPTRHCAPLTTTSPTKTSRRWETVTRSRQTAWRDTSTGLIWSRAASYKMNRVQSVYYNKNHHNSYDI